MKAVTAFPGQPDSIHLRDVPTPRLDEVPGGRWVLVRVVLVRVPRRSERALRSRSNSLSSVPR